MNEYGAQLKQHWKRYRSQELVQLTDPDAFFQAQGQEIAEQIQTREDLLAEQAEQERPTHGDYQAKLAQLETAKFTARSEVMREYLTLPEDEEE